MLVPRLFVVVSAVAVATGSVHAQGSTIQAGTATSTVLSQSSARHGVAIDAHGVMWALVREADSVTGALDLYLRASTDGGANWSGRFDTPTSGDGLGSVAVGPGCNELQLTWSASNGGAFSNAYYQAFDVATASFVGTPLQLTNATNSNDQYYGQDIQVTDNGALVIAASCHRGPASPPWTAWCAALFVRPRGAAVFDPPRVVNTDAYGQLIDLQAVGNVVHAAFRTNTGLYGTRYRAFDTSSMQFTTATDVQVELGTSNVSNIAADADGNLYVAYAKGGTAAGTGEIWVASAAPGAYGTWNPQLVASDPPLVRGNVTDYHYTLASDGTGQVAVFYSKANEQYQTLYFRLFTGGVLSTPELPVAASTDPNRFVVLSGVRNSANLLSIAVVTESRAAVHPGNLISFVQLGPSGTATRFGISCAGGAASAPTLRATGIPTSNGTIGLEVRTSIQATPCFLLLGLSCIEPPLDLGLIGMNGCTLNVTSVGTLTAATGASGTAVFSLVTPARPFPGLSLYFQSVVVAPAANALSLLTSNAVVTTLW